MRADLPYSVGSEELMTGADLPASIFYGGTQYRNGVTKGLITKADQPQGRKEGFHYYTVSNISYFPTLGIYRHPWNIPIPTV
jgi:hypothetical protein